MEADGPPQEGEGVMHASTAERDYPEVCEKFQPGMAAMVMGHPDYDTVSGVDRGGWVVVKASRYDKPGCYPVTLSVAPESVVVFVPEAPTQCCGATHKGSANSPTGLVCRACYKPINQEGRNV